MNMPIGDQAIQILAGAAALGLLIYFLWRGAEKQVFDRAEAARRDGRTPLAEKLYRKLLRQMGGNDGAVQRRNAARVALGEICHATGRASEAAELFHEAFDRGVTLSDEARNLLADRLAGLNGTEERAIEECLAAVERGHASDVVLEYLKQICTVKENMAAAERSLAVKRLERVVAGAPNVEWAHYFLGLASLLGSQYGKAAGALSRALEINPERALTYYWLGVCKLQAQPPELEAAIALLERFLLEPVSNDRVRLRQANAASEIARRLYRNDASRAVGFADRAIHLAPEDASYQFLAGKVYLALGRDTEALSSLEAACGLAPKDLTYRSRLAAEYDRAGREEAVPAYEAVLSLDADNVQAHAALGRIYLLGKKFGRSRNHAAAALKLDSTRHDCCAILVQALHHLGEFAAAVEASAGWSRMFVAQLEDPDTLFAVGHSLSKLGDFAKARTWLQRNPRNEKLRYYSGCAAANGQDYAAALTDFAGVIENGGGYRSRAFLQRGHVLRTIGKLAEAEADYREALAAGHEETSTRRSLAAVLLQAGRGADATTVLQGVADPQCQFLLGLAYEMLGQTAEATDTYSRLAESASASVDALQRLVILSAQKGDYTSALQHFRRLPGKDTPLGVELYASIALVHTEGNLAEGVALMKAIPTGNLSSTEGERLQVNIARAEHMLGCEHARHQRLAEAAAAWESYLRVLPDDHQTAGDLAAIYTLMAIEVLSKSADATDEARKLLGRALELDSANETSRYAAALCEMAAGRPKAALSHLTRMEDSNPRLLYHRALCRLQLGDSAEALRMFEAVYCEFPDSPYADLARAALANERLRAGALEDALQVL